MRKRNDMYIDYRKSHRKKRRWRNRAKNRLPAVLIAIIILITIVYIAVKVYIKAGDRNDDTAAVDISQSENRIDINSDGLNKADNIIHTGNAPENKPADLVNQPAAEPTPDDAISVTETYAREPVRVKGIYITAPLAGSERINDLIEFIDKTELNAVVIDVKDDYGKITYTMDSDTACEIGAVTKTIPDIASLLESLKSHNIYTIARIVTFKDPLLAEKKQEYAIKNNDGSIYRDSNGEAWVNPYNRKIWDYLVEIAANAAEDGFDEVQFDYIRFSTGKGISKADLGEESKTVSRTEIINEFTKYIYEKIKPYGVYISADVYGTIISSSVDSALVGQDYTEMAKHLDYICPMIYPSHFSEGSYGIEYPDMEPYNIISKVMAASNTRLSSIEENEHKAVVRPWLQAFTATWIKKHKKYGGDEIKQQIDGVYSAGCNEWLLWNAAGSYSGDGLMQEQADRESKYFE